MISSFFPLLSVSFLFPFRNRLSLLLFSFVSSDSFSEQAFSNLQPYYILLCQQLHLCMIVNPVGCGLKPIMLEDGVMVDNQSVTRQPKCSYDLHHSI